MISSFKWENKILTQNKFIWAQLEEIPHHEVFFDDRRQF